MGTLTTRSTIVLAVVAVFAETVAGNAAERRRISIAKFALTAEGSQVYVITLRNERCMRVRVLSRGGAIIEISTPDRQGKVTNVVLSAADFLAQEAFNSIVGRYANRIGGGGFMLDGAFYSLQADPITHVVLHGGSGGFGTKLWKATASARPGAAVLRLHYVSRDGENGFPGELSVQVTYTLDDLGALELDYEATTSKPTVLNLTNHTFFNLSGHPSGSIYGHWLQVFADHWTPTDKFQIPTGEIAPVAGTPFDFRRPVLIRERVYSPHPQMVLARGLDHNFVLQKPPKHAISAAARLWDPDSGRQMEVRTTEPGVQIYTANYFTGASVAADARTLRQGDGITFETQHFPDSPNKPEFPSTVLRPGKIFRSTTQFIFSTDKEHRFFDPAETAGINPNYEPSSSIQQKSCDE